MQRLLASLRFQVTAAFGVLVALFAAASLATLTAFERQVDADAVVDIAARLELTASHMHMQAMNYDANAPRDYPTYYRDVELFYRDLTTQMALFDAVVAGFMSGDFTAVLERPAAWMQPARQPRLQAAVTKLEEAWQTHRAGLMEALGEDTEEPRLEWAAEFNIEHLGRVEAAASALAEQLRQWAIAEHARLRWLVALGLGGAIAVALLLVLLLQVYGLRPLRQTLDGVARAAGGDFGHQVRVRGATEARDLAAGFNALSGKLDLLFQLLERLQRGNDVDELVAFLSRDFRELLRFDWIGVVLVTPDSAAVQLESSAMDGDPEAGSKPLFRLRGTLLEEALAAGRPLHIRDVSTTAAENPGYEFLRDIARRGLADAIFLPVAVGTPIPAVIAFATRQAGRYDDAHLEFLTNIAELLSASFGRTVRFAERRRLADIGELASGIAHELRSPLATISLALEHFARLALPANSRRRVVLASGEAARMQRLLDDILLYAKPLRLTLEPIDLVTLTAATLEAARGGRACTAQAIQFSTDQPAAWVLGDQDRLRQILENLLSNACEAAPEQARVDVRLERVDRRWLRLIIDNPGEPPDPELLARIFEPFVSAKPGGTGLGLAIVQRLTTLHGGRVWLEPAGDDRVRAVVQLPLADSKEAPGGAPTPQARGAASLGTGR